MFDSTSKFLVIRYKRNRTGALEMDKKIQAPGDTIEEAIERFEDTSYNGDYVELVHIKRREVIQFRYNATGKLI